MQGQVESPLALCELVLVELYMALRNPVIFPKPYPACRAAEYCLRLKSNPAWTCIDYAPAVAQALWNWATDTERGYRTIVDARIALTLRHHGIREFATMNLKDFQGFGFQRVWNPLA